MTAADVAVLDDRERRILSAVCLAFMPALPPGTGDAAELFALTAGDLDLATAIEHAMAALSGRQRRELRLFIRLLDSRAFMLALTGRPVGFTRMQPREREATLIALADSPIAAVRSGYQALKRLATFLFYSVTREAGENPTWRPIGYAPLKPSPGTSAVRLTPVTGSTIVDADVCVVGSGAGGGVVAALLAAAGRRVVVLEAGSGDQGAEYDQREITGMQRLYLDRGTTATRDLGIAMLAGSALGGGTAVNWQTSLRLPDFVRDEWAERSGIRAFGAQEFTRALDAVCERLGVGDAESVVNANNLPLERGCAALGFRTTRIPRNSRGCDLEQCGYCMFGCRIGGKQSTTNTYLLDAQRDGDCVVIASCRAESIRLDRGAVAGVDAIGADGSGARHPVRVNAPLVVAAAGALETPALLLRSGVRHGHIGRNLHLHPTTAVAGRYAELIRGWVGAPQTVLCDEFARYRGNYGFRLEAAPVHPGLIAMALPWHGARAHRATMQHAAHVGALIVLARDRGTGRVRIDGEGRPVADYAVGRMERELLREGIATAARVHWAAGADEIHSLHTREHAFRRGGSARSIDIGTFCARLLRAPVHGNRCALFSAHQMGTCRMGSEVREAVCDERGRVRGVRGLFVADASLFPASSGVNPMITVMAIAHMVGTGIAQAATS